jgi:hypothetical protein
MDTTITDFTPPIPTVEATPSALTPAIRRVITRETTKEFVRRPAKGWTGSTPVPVLRFDHHCAVWGQ